MTTSVSVHFAEITLLVICIMTRGIAGSQVTVWRVQETLCGECMCI